MGGDAALGKEVEHGQEQEGFVWGAEGGNGRPRGVVLIGMQVGKQAQILVKSGHG